MMRFKKMISCLTILVCLSAVSIHAQDDATYVDDIAAEDSSYSEDIFMAEEEEAVAETEKSNTGLFIAIGAVVVVGLAFIVMKKKK